MPLTPGTRLGPYEIVGPLGAGGMGEVYKARDIRLDRTVALKILPLELAADPQFRERFDREAKSISALSHPHICALYDVGEVAGPDAPAGASIGALRYIVLEHLEGETLAARLTKGSLPLADSLRIGLDILSALDAAHRRGIVHRDLKPANIMLTRTGAKLLDFGLAKAGSPLTPAPGASVLPTMEAPLTAGGTILGTFQYMAPEQVEGEAADARTDLFAFGSVLFEMITGRRAFGGKSQASLLGAILKEDPPPVSEVQNVAPPALDHLVRTCLAKNPDDRYQTAHDVWLQLKWILDGGSAAGVPAPVVARRYARERFAWLLSAVLGAAAVAAGLLAFMNGRNAAPPQPIEFTVTAEDGSVPSAGVAISPDGRQLVFSTLSQTGGRGLWIRTLTSQVTRPIRGGESGVLPFWAPDSRQIGFFAGGKLRKMDAAGGTSLPLCDVGTPSGGGTWGANDVIVFSSTAATSALRKVNAAGGDCAPLTTLAEGEVGHQQPEFLPGGSHVLYYALGATSRKLAVASVESGASTTIGVTESAALYGSGHLLFARAGALVAQPFDARRLRLSGEPFMISPQVAVAPSGRLFAGVAGDVLAYARNVVAPLSRLTWLDRAGKTIGVVGEMASYQNLSLSPDERLVAASMTAGSPANRDIWLIDLARGDTASRRTFDAAVDADPAWSPDGRQIVFNSNRDNGFYNTAFVLQTDGSGTEMTLVKMERLVDSPEWSHDGRSMVFTGGTKGSSNDLWMVNLSGDRTPKVLAETPFAEDSPAFSPDDRWIAYNANPSDRFEVFVRSATPGGGQVQISRDGGWAPRWRGDGRELFFLALDGKMMAADISVTPSGLQAGVPRPLFATPLRRSTERRPFVVTKEGTRFLLPIAEGSPAAIPLTVVVNWRPAQPR